MTDIFNHLTRLWFEPITFGHVITAFVVYQVFMVIRDWVRGY